MVYPPHNTATNHHAQVPRDDHTPDSHHSHFQRAQIPFPQEHCRQGQRNTTTREGNEKEALWEDKNSSCHHGSSFGMHEQLTPHNAAMRRGSLHALRNSHSSIKARPAPHSLTPFSGRLTPPGEPAPCYFSSPTLPGPALHNPLPSDSAPFPT